MSKNVGFPAGLIVFGRSDACERMHQISKQQTSDSKPSSSKHQTTDQFILF